MHSGHRERMRKKILTTNGSEIPPHEILEVLLYSTNTQRDTNPLAHELINKFGTLSAVFDADFEELLKVKGIGVSSAQLIKMVPKIASAYMQDKNSFPNKLITESEDAFYYVRPHYVEVTDEMPSALCLNNSGKVLGFDKIGEGNVSVTEISVRKLVEVALKYNAAQVILFHNHPSGIAIPSKNDIISTKNLVEVLKNIGVSLVDHIVVAGDDFVSMADSKEFSFIFER